jgi:protein involved in polysaccharide export with SLBB domain
MVVACSVMGCPRGGTPVTQFPTTMPAASASPKVEPGDNLEVEVFGEEDLSGKFQVSERGTIDYPLVGRVKVGGLTPPEVATLLRKKLADGFLKNPHVRVLAEGYQGKKKVYVWGQVSKPGTFPFSAGMTMIEALTLAGGLTPLAARDGITVTRTVDGELKKHSVEMGDAKSATFALRPGDVIFVPERVF